jgi:2-dehydro-3-deoxy-D-arabinonate dehydratase
MLLVNTDMGPAIETAKGYAALAGHSWDALLARDDLPEFLVERIRQPDALMWLNKMPRLRAPIGSQEVWAAGVTYFRSRTARMEESREAGGGDFYDKVYHADRPELFLKATPLRVVGPDAPLKLRSDSNWNVPEPELTLLVSSGGRITGYTIGNDLSSRDIEGQNPLYLPQAKTYDGCAALGPGILITSEPIPRSTEIHLSISRSGEVCFEGKTALSEMKKDLDTLVTYLCRSLSFPTGCFLMTGTGIVPEDDFSLREGDIVSITIDPVGTLRNSISK